jgi:lipopolysaccharide/colanic/teichoic acid biosynthesis glycosyltransferase
MPGPFPIIGVGVNRPATTGPRRAERSQRLLDVVAGGAALVLLSPLLAVIAVLVRLTSRGPALFRQSRIGYRGQPFPMLKFRSMYVDCDDAIHRDFTRRELLGEDPRDAADRLFKPAHDPRITPLGRVLRATSIDELPQLINVLRGEMSLVGPRPALDWETDLYQPHHRERFRVKPGITGLWQVSGRSRLTMLQALDLDVAYVRRRSLLLDLKIIAMTVPALLQPRSAR